MVRTASRLLAALLWSAVGCVHVVTQDEQRADGARCFTLPSGWSFLERPIAIRKAAAGTDRLLPSDELVAVIFGMSGGDTGMPSRGLPSVGLAAIRFDVDGAGRITWTKWLGDIGTHVHLAGGWDMTSDGAPDVLVSISPRPDRAYLSGTLMVLSSSDGAIFSTTTVATDGLEVGAGAPTGEGPAATSTRFLIEATNGTAPAKLVEFDVASGIARVSPFAVDGAGMVHDGLVWIGQQPGRAEPSIAVRVQNLAADSRWLPDSRIVAIDLDTNEQLALYKGTFVAGMCRAVAIEGQATDDIMIAEVCEEVLPSHCVWLELRRVSTRTGKVLSTSTFPLDDKLGDILMASYFGASIDAWDDMDGDGTRDYVCSLGCTCPEDVWRLLLVSGATGALLGRIDSAMLARHLGPDLPQGNAPYFGVPLLMAPGAVPAIAVCLGGEDLDAGSSSVTVLELSECLSAR